jgi:uncharacterized protein YcfJ
MNPFMRSTLVMAGVAFAAPVFAQITLYESDNFHGKTFTTQRSTDNLERYGFNDRASSAVVILDRWEVCEDARFGGKCVVLRPGQYASLAGLGMNNKISSVRMLSSSVRVDDNRYAPMPVMDSPYRRRGNEKLYEANVTSVHAVMGTPEQRCWVEHEPAPQEKSGPNVPGAVVGALIGGVLGHQVGNGRGNDLATAGGAVAGAVVGSNVGRDNGGSQGYGQDVQRCSTPASSQARPDYWEVTYEFRGQQHRMQVTNPPGRTVTVNEQGEPRA